MFPWRHGRLGEADRSGPRVLATAFATTFVPCHRWVIVETFGRVGKRWQLSKSPTRVFNFQHLRQSKLMNLKSCTQNRHRWTYFLGTWLGSPEFSDWLAWGRLQAIAFIARVKSKKHSFYWKAFVFGVKSKNFLGSWKKVYSLLGMMHFVG